MAMDEDLAWLKQAISKGLMGLVVLHLEGGPSAETVAKTAGVWFHVLKSWPIAWHEELDRPRLRTAFTLLAGQARRWPSPSDLRLLMPQRVYPNQALSEPEYPVDKAKHNLAVIRKLRSLADLRASLLRQLAEATRRKDKADLEEAIASIEKQQREAPYQ